MNILLVFPNAVLQNPPPMSIALFTALLRPLGVSLHLFDTTLYDTEERTSDKTKEQHLQVRPFSFTERNITLNTTDMYEDFRHCLEQVQPELIALSANEVTFPTGMELLRRARGDAALARATVVAGGVLATCAPEYVLGHEGIDAVVCGEGEGALVDIVGRLQRGTGLNGIANVRVKDRATGAVTGSPLRPPVVLDDLPLPDYSLFDERRFYRPMAGRVWRLFPVESSRGCPYRCTFCNSPSLEEMYRADTGRGFFRRKSVARLERELRDLKEKYGAEYIYFLSDTLLAMSDNEFDEFCRMYAGIGLPFWCQNRVEMVTEPRMRRLKEIGCHRMSVGIEHGNEEFRFRMLDKRITNAAIIRAFEILAQVGIPATANNIVGFPDETRELAMDTVRLNRQIPYDTVNAYEFTPFRGTPLHRYCLERGYISEDTVLTCMTKGTVLRMPQFPPQDIEGLVRTFALYTRLPEERFPEIRRAENDDRLFARLSAEYQRLQFGK